MQAPKECPDCGSFDVGLVETDNDLAWFHCRTCHTEWIEEVVGVGFDVADDEAAYYGGFLEDGEFWTKFPPGERPGHLFRLARKECRQCPVAASAGARQRRA